jgi:uncharacterized protein YceK
MKMKRIANLSLVLGALVLTSGCASIVTGTKRKVAFNSNPPGASVTVVNEQGKTVAQGTTPFKAKLVKGKPYFVGNQYTATFTLDGYAPAEQQVKSHINGWYFGNIVFGGLIGFIIVDPLTGAMYTLPKDVTVSLNPKTAALPEKPATRVVQLQDIPAPVRARLIPITPHFSR